MIAWWDGLELLVKILYCIAVPSTLLLVIQTILSMAGGLDSGPGIDISDTSGMDLSMGDVALDGNFHTGFDGALDHGGSDMVRDTGDPGQLESSMDGGNPGDMSVFHLFTLQSMVAFFTVFSWSSIVSIQTGTPETIGILMGLIFGFIAMFGVAKLIQLSKKITESGTLNMRNAIGESASVYIPIPPNGSGQGKVMLNLQGRFVESSAITNHDTLLPTGSSVRVVDLRNEVFVVELDK